MRREGTLFIVLWFILIGTIYIVYFNAKSIVINSIDALRKVIVEFDNNNQVSISWSQ